MRLLGTAAVYLTNPLLRLSGGALLLSDLTYTGMAGRPGTERSFQVSGPRAAMAVRRRWPDNPVMPPDLRRFLLPTATDN